MNTTAIPRIPDLPPEPFSKALTKVHVVVLLGVSIISINASFIHVFRKNQIFYLNPRYILFIHLVVNDIINVMMSVIPFLANYTIHKINYSICCILILAALFAAENTPLIVACMAVECYIAVCFPLHHSRICTIKKTLMLFGVIWMIGVLLVLSDLFVTLATQPLEFFYSPIFCHPANLFPNPDLVKILNIIYGLFLVFLWFTLIYMYFRILFTARAASKDSKKARNTIMLHGFQLLLCTVTYAGPQLQDFLHRWFPFNIRDTRFSSFIVMSFLPRSISPMMYGLRDETFRKYLKRNMMCKCSFMKNNTEYFPSKSVKCKV